MNRKNIIVVVLLQLLFLVGAAQNDEIRFNLVEGPGGKPLGKIRNITQDRYGYIWLSGEGEKCIYRYDGNRFSIFRHSDDNPNSLGGTNINSVYADENGMIWIGMTEGLDRFDPVTGIFKHYRHEKNNPESLGENPAPVLRDRQGRLWIGTYSGLDRLDEKTGKFFHYRNDPGNPKSLSSNVVWNIYEDHEGVIWVATGHPWNNENPDDGGLDRLNADGTCTRYMHDPKDPRSLINNKVAAMFEDSKGVFWVGTSGDGLHTMDRRTGLFERHLYDPKNPDHVSRPPLRPGEANDKITFITGDSTGAVWIGTMYSGISRYDPATKKMTHFEHSNGFADSSSWNAFTSRDGEVWISTQDNNLYRADPFHKTISNIATPADPWGFLEDGNGYLWVGTRGAGLLRFDKRLNLIQQFRHNPSDPLSLPSDQIGPLFQFQENTIWVVTEKGMRSLDAATQKFSRFRDGENLKVFDDTGATSILLDKKGLIWFSRWGQGLVRYNPKDHSINHFYSSETDSSSIGSNNVGQLAQNSQGTLWVGSANGLDRLDKKTGKFERYMTGTGSWTLHVNYDKEGNLWAPTQNGLFRYSDSENRFINFLDPQAGFSALGLGGIIEDNKKNLWSFSQSDIVRINPITNQTAIYGSRYGIAPNSMAIWKNPQQSREGKIFIPNENGFYAFSPEELNAVTDLKIIITGLSINSVALLASKNNQVQKPVEEIGDLILHYNQNNISLNFAAIDYRQPEATQYFYMLEGYDREWHEVKDKEEKSAHYFNLPVGEYSFRIKAFNQEGTKAEKTISIHITPPWWQTWWAYASYVLLLFFSVWAFITMRTRALQKDKIVLEEKVALRTMELKKEKEIVERTLSELKTTQALLIQSEKMASLGELTAGIAHEIQNPLNFVNNFSEINTELIEELMAEQKKENRDFEMEGGILNDIRENGQKINHHGKRADAIVKGMLQHSRSSTGHKEPTDINAIADEYLRLAYHGLRAKDKSFNAVMQTDFDKSIGHINIVSQEIGRAVLNLITNAFYAVAEKKKKMGDGFEPTVTVSTKKMNGKIEIRVSDNGNGIPQNILDKIFQPFFTTKPTGQGTGLGLSLAYDIVRAHGGELRAETNDGEGATFVLQLNRDS